LPSPWQGAHRSRNLLFLTSAGKSLREAGLSLHEAQPGMEQNEKTLAVLMLHPLSSAPPVTQ